MLEAILILCPVLSDLLETLRIGFYWRGVVLGPSNEHVSSKGLQMHYHTYEFVWCWLNPPFLLLFWLLWGAPTNEIYFLLMICTFPFMADELDSIPIFLISILV